MFTLKVTLRLPDGNEITTMRVFTDKDVACTAPEHRKDKFLDKYHAAARELLNVRPIEAAIDHVTIAGQAPLQSPLAQPRTPTHGESTTTAPTAPSTPPAPPTDEAGPPTNVPD